MVLRYWGDLSIDQVAATLGCSPGNVKSQSARALAKLRVLLGDAMPERGFQGVAPLGQHQLGAPGPRVAGQADVSDARHG